MKFPKCKSHFAANHPMCKLIRPMRDQSLINSKKLLCSWCNLNHCFWTFLLSRNDLTWPWRTIRGIVAKWYQWRIQKLGIGGGRVGGGVWAMPPLQKFFLKIWCNITHFGAKLSYVLDASGRQGGRPLPAPLESATEWYIVSQKRWEIGPRLLLTTNRKSHKPFTLT